MYIVFIQKVIELLNSITFVHKYYDMRKLVCFAMLLWGLVSCKDETHVTIFEDMMYFFENTLKPEDYASPITVLHVQPHSQIELLIGRNVFAANEHPKQTVRIVVDEYHTTANPETDFSFDQQVLNFPNKNVLQLPLQVTIHSGAAGKIIALRLDYEYYDECPQNGRRCDRLIINVQKDSLE